MPERRDVDLHRVPETVQLLVFHRDSAADTSVVDEHVDAAEAIEHVRHQAFTIGFIGDVGNDDVRAGQLSSQFVEPVGAPGGQHHRGADGVEHRCEVGAQA